MSDGTWRQWDMENTMVLGIKGCKATAGFATEEMGMDPDTIPIDDITLCVSGESVMSNPDDNGQLTKEVHYQLYFDGAEVALQTVEAVLSTILDAEGLKALADVFSKEFIRMNQQGTQPAILSDYLEHRLRKMVGDDASS